MAFPPEFLEEIRRRLPLSGVVGRRVRLAKKGREFEGLCPFHNEKTPSFFVNDDKAFYHCFGCGAHGDAISFVINTEGLSFPEAVEKLAEEAGLDVPRQVQIDPAERQRRVSAGSALEAACMFFELELRKPGGRVGLDYLKRRGLSEDDISRFRLGFAPDSRGMLKAALIKQGYSEEMLLDGGLLIRPAGDARGEPAGDARVENEAAAPAPARDGPAESYDRFRGRVMFPIADRRGQIIAFGGRVLGDGQPKYLNSPDTPLFHKGRVLYALHFAREAVRPQAQSASPSEQAAWSETTPRAAILVEGYMDVVALHKAGFRTAMAPLGTALTEEQLAETWRLSPEPYLCFDGDAAGQRAAARAALRALPLLEPGRSLRLVFLPTGQDPDELLRGPEGAAGFRAQLEAAKSLVDHLWDSESQAAPLDTPERRAALRMRLNELSAKIAQPDVREFYRQEFAERQRRLFAPAKQAGGFYKARPIADKQGRKYLKVAPRGLRQPIQVGERAVCKAFLAAFLNHPALLDEYGESLADLSFADQRLDNIRGELVHIWATSAGLDAASLHAHLAECGHEALLGTILCVDVYRQFSGFRPAVPLEKVRSWCDHLFSRIHARQLEDELKRAEAAAVAEGTPESAARFRAVLAEWAAVAAGDPFSDDNDRPVRTEADK